MARSEYDRWNQAIADVVFSPRQDGRPVYLDLDDLDAISGAAGLDGQEPRSALCRAVASQLTGHRPLRLIASRLDRWDSRSGAPPPVLALLAVLVLAAEEMHWGDGFAPNNYYDRLMPLLGRSSKLEKDQVVNHYRDLSARLWGALNDWLAALAGSRGVPTAFPYSSHEHVSVPMAQALVRAHDRDLLEEMFVDQGLPAGLTMAPEEMDALIDDAMSRTGFSGHLRRLWTIRSARERIAQVSCQVLTAWPGSGEVLSGDAAKVLGRGLGLSLTALVRTFGRPGMELNVSGSMRGVSLDIVEVIGPDDVAVAALRAEPLGEARWSLSDPDGLDLLSVLESELVLQTPSGAQYRRLPHRLVPFRKDGTLQCYIEVERLQLGDDGLVLVREALVAEVEAALSRMARPGFRLRRELRGVPDGWAVFSNVQVLAALPDDRRWAHELNLLQPLASSQVSIEGGLRLPGAIRWWSTMVPPELRASARKADRLRVEVVRVVEGEVDRVLERTFEGSVAVLPLTGLETGDYQVKVTTDGSSKRLDQLQLRLRTGDEPRVLIEHAPALTHRAANAWSMLSAEGAEQPAGIRGALSQRLDPSPPPAPPPAKPAWWENRRQSTRTPAPARVRIVVPPSSKGACVKTGAHHLIFPTAGKTRAKTIEGECKLCGMVKRQPGRFRPKSTGKPTKPTEGPQFDVTKTRPVSDAGPISIDHAFDALVFTREGPLSAFHRVAFQVDQSNLFADAFLRALEDLGHVEVRRDPTTLRTVEWQMTPPTLYERAPGTWCLAGARSSRLLDALQDWAREAGLVLSRDRQERAPERIQISGLPPSAAAELAAEVERRTQIGLALAPNASERLTLSLVPLSMALGALPTVTVPSATSARMWDTALARWRPVADISRTGAFHVAAPVPAYLLRTQQDLNDGTARRADARLAKHGDALADGGLCGYDGSSRTLFVPLGADLPVLYARPATLASGLLPKEDESSRTLAYTDVPGALAARLHGLLTAKGR